MHLSHKLLVTGLCVMLLAGCGVTRPSKFYILTPVAEDDVAAQAVAGPALGIGPVAFPVYLERPEIAHRSGDNQLHYAGSHRWAEPLKTSFSRTLAKNLSILVPTYRINMYPWSRSASPDYQVILDITRFDADASGTVTLSANWEVIRLEGSSAINRQKSTYTESAGSMAYPAIVAAQSRAVAGLSRDIAAALAHAGKAPRKHTEAH
jgi:uncharacterized lipoprotein YmbA